MSKIKKISLLGAVETDVTLKDLMGQCGDAGLFDTLVLDIASQGGCVEEGLKIMVWLDQISQMGKEVITVVSANAYSIASLIMLSADKRYISKHGEVMVHNPMVPLVEYANANELEKHVNELRMLENMLQTIYTQFANISLEDIRVLMDNETYLSPDEAVKRGFADEVIDVKPKPYQMMAIKREVNMKNTRNILNVVIAAINGSEVVNQMYYNTKGEELQIYQANPAKYGIGDKTSMEKGDVRLSDGTMISIVNFEISNIEKEVEEAPVAEEAIPEGEVAVEDAPIVEKPVAENNVGPAPVDPIEKPKAVAQAVVNVTKIDDEPVATLAPAVEPVAVIEPVAPVAADPIEPTTVEVIQSIDPIEPAAEPVVEPIAVEPIVEEPIAEEDSHAQKMVELEAKCMDLMARIEALESKQGSNQEFENLATEAIETLAKNTSSAFRPEAQLVMVKEDESSKGNSIFTRFKNRQNQK